MSKKVQAEIEAQHELILASNATKTEITLSNGKKIHIGWLMFDAQDKIDSVFVKYELMKKSVDENDKHAVQKANKETRRFYARSVAAILINNYFGIKLFWWIKWRIIYHFWNLNGNDYMKIIDEAKKKATEPEYYAAMAYLMTMPDTWKILTKKQAEAYLQEVELANKRAL